MPGDWLGFTPNATVLFMSCITDILKGLLYKETPKKKNQICPPQKGALICSTAKNGGDLFHEREVNHAPQGRPGNNLDRCQIDGDSSKMLRYVYATLEPGNLGQLFFGWDAQSSRDKISI